MPLVEVRTGRRPFQLAVLITSAASGISGLTIPATRSVVIAKAFDWSDFALFWYAGIAVFALTALVGVLVIRDLVAGFQVERIGLVGLAIACPVYAISAIAATGYSATLVAMSYGLAYGGACAWRVREIHRDIPLVRAEHDAVLDATLQAARHDAGRDGAAP